MEMISLIAKRWLPEPARTVGTSSEERHLRRSQRHTSLEHVGATDRHRTVLSPDLEQLQPVRCRRWAPVGAISSRVSRHRTNPSDIGGQGGLKGGPQATNRLSARSAASLGPDKSMIRIRVPVARARARATENLCPALGGHPLLSRRPRALSPPRPSVGGRTRGHSGLSTGAEGRGSMGSYTQPNNG